MLTNLLSGFPDPVVAVLGLLVIISVLVIAHELGHFIAARLLGVGVEEFALGLPFTKPLWTKITKKGLKISVYPALFGGFVRLMGEERSEMEKPKLKKGQKLEEQFWAQPVWRRFLIIVAGVTANVIFAVVAFSVIYFFTGIPKESSNVRIIGVVSGSPADSAGIKVGDVVIGIEVKEKLGGLKVGKAMTSTEGFINFVDQNRGKTLDIQIKRDGKELQLNAVPRINPPQGEGALGVGITTTEMVFLPFPQMLVSSVQNGVKETKQWVQLTVLGTANVFKELFSGKVPADVGGPLRIAQVSVVVAKEGAITILSFLGILSINLAVINIIPFPALDGGHALFLIIEAIFGRRVAPKLEHWIHTAGLVILLFLVILISIRDAGSILGESGILK
ncbi:MAG: RIP metalloprotease RseP [Microgenomates group bacterium GW2011_GWA2_44_7]|nr:MAG: RIP metalloprotease RseP [Microgenomates group bacterium GW2011_GWA2_44_7]